jgi:hypothetical protein
VIDLLSTMQAVLRDAGFRTRLISLERSPVLSFEDDIVIGFGCAFDDPDSLLTRWTSLEMSLLMRYAGNLRAAGDKAWNVYCVFLATRPGDTIQNRQIRWIEENLERTRKIAACGVGTREALVRALLPLLPLQFQPTLQAEDITLRLVRRIQSIAPRAAGVFLNEATPADEIARLLREPQ